MDAESRPDAHIGEDAATVVAAVPAQGARYAAIVRKTGLPTGRVENGLHGALQAGALIRLLDGRYVRSITPPRDRDPAPAQTAKGKANGRIKRAYVRREPDARGWWHCTRCTSWKPNNQFRLVAQTKRPRSHCRKCERADMAERRA